MPSANDEYAIHAFSCGLYVMLYYIYVVRIPFNINKIKENTSLRQDFRNVMLLITSSIIYNHKAYLALLMLGKVLGSAAHLS